MINQEMLFLPKPTLFQQQVDPFGVGIDYAGQLLIFYISGEFDYFNNFHLVLMVSVMISYLF